MLMLPNFTASTENSLPGLTFEGQSLYSRLNQVSKDEINLDGCTITTESMVAVSFYFVCQPSLGLTLALS